MVEENEYSVPLNTTASCGVLMMVAERKWELGVL